MNKNELYNKYVDEIKAVGQHIIDNAENILNDFETEHIREINIMSNIRYGELPTVDINKSYAPRQIFLKKEPKILEDETCEWCGGKLYEDYICSECGLETECK